MSADPSTPAAQGSPALVVDVLIPAFGDNPLLRAAVTSVLTQTSPAWALTVVDDGPPDADLAAWFSGLADPRVRYLANPQNLGINRNFQRCVDLAEHDLVVLMGADDRMLPPYVSIVAAAARRAPTVTLIQPGVRVIDGDGVVVRPLADRLKDLLAPTVHGVRSLAGEELAVSLLRGNWMYFPAVAFRREALQAHGFSTGYDVVQDIDLYLRLLVDGGRLMLLEQVAFEYRRHAASVSSTEAASGQRFAEERAFFTSMARQFDRLGWRRAARAADRHVASRLHALSRVPGAVAARDIDRLRALGRHALR